MALRLAIEQRNDKLAQIAKEIKKTGRRAVKIGIQAPEASTMHGSLEMVDLAFIHEFGTDVVPRRAFIRAPMDAKRRYWKGEISGIFDNLLTLLMNDADEKLLALGEEYKDAILERIAAGISPRLKPDTIARKGNDIALLDTGAMVNSITVKLRESA